MSGIADEVGTLLRTEIDHMGKLSATEASALRLLSRATESALRIAANPEDKGYAFASDFLASILDDALQDGVEPSDDTEADVDAEMEKSGGSRFDDEVVGERDPYLIDITSLVGKELSAQADKGFELLKAHMKKGGYEFLAREVYFQPDEKGMGYIKIDGVFLDAKGGVVFGEAKMGNADLTKNQKSGLPMLREGKGTFYGKEAAIIADKLDIKPDANGRFRIPAHQILEVYIFTPGRTRAGCDCGS